MSVKRNEINGWKDAGVHSSLTAAALVLLAGAGIALAPSAAQATDGHFLHGVGPVNQSMGGASTGAIIDPLGTVMWNPAGTIKFKGTEAIVSLEYFIPDRSLSSTVNANAFGPSFPAATLSGKTTSETNAAFMPSFAIAYHPEDSDTAYHMGLIAVAGFGVEFGGSRTASPTANPFLTPQPPRGFGFGKLTSNYQLMRIPLGISHKFSDTFAVGVSVIPSAAALQVSPAPFATPDDANGDGFGTYPDAGDLEWAYGIGAQVGVLWDVNEQLTVGASFATPTWFSDFTWDSKDETGAHRDLFFNMDLPMFIGAGVGWKIADGTLLAADARWIDYENTDGFKDQGFNANGSVKGFGWRSIWVIGIGLQQDLGDKFKVRLGYNYTDNPIPSDLMFFNTPANAIVQHHVTAGLSYEINEKATLHLGYYHAFKNEVSGPWHSGAGPIAGTSVKTDLSEDSISIGFSYKF